jgi:chemotaxis protein CheX
MNSLAVIPPGAQPIAADIYEQLLGPIIVGFETALRDVAMTEAALRQTYQMRSHRFSGDLVARLELSSATTECLALGVIAETAAALARRVLSETELNPDDALIRDCVGEIANVAAGQAKALLHGTPHQFTFGTPRIASAAELVVTDMEVYLVAVMATDVGEVVVQVGLRQSR